MLHSDCGLHIVFGFNGIQVSRFDCGLNTGMAQEGCGHECAKSRLPGNLIFFKGAQRLSSRSSHVS